MKVTVKYDDRGASKRMRAIRDEVDRMIDKEIAVAGRDTARTAKSYAPVNFGRLKNSIRVDSKPKISVVGAYATYAPYVEFGTGTGVIVPQELQKYAMQFKGQGIRQVNTKAQPYLYPAFFLNREKLNDRTDKKIADIFRKNSRG